MWQLRIGVESEAVGLMSYRPIFTREFCECQAVGHAESNTVIENNPKKRLHKTWREHLAYFEEELVYWLERHVSETLV